ncbi:MAG: class I SAM-dependent methyltransferase [Bacteroidetes bacterium]|nr:class I SAM-dependent methyltransferase [Bacteroidota bacterium]
MSRSQDVLKPPQWWLPVLQQIAGLPDFQVSTLQRFVPSLKQLSSHLNDVEERREKGAPYMRDRRLREAYLLYYATCNFLKLAWPLYELWPAGPPMGDAPLRILDVGCGPGTGIAALHAWADTHTSTRPLLVYGIDTVEGNATLYREMGRLLREHSGHDFACDATVGDARHLAGEEGSFDLVMGMNVLNEIPEVAQQRFLARCAELLAPGGAMVLIEPALRTTSRTLLQLRDHAVTQGWSVIAPCFRQGCCPALVNEKDWCHHDVPWERPPFIAWIDEEIGNIKRSLKFSTLVLSRDTTAVQGDSAGGTLQRVVSEMFVEKGRTWCFCCGVQGRRVYQRNHRDRSELNGAFDNLQRYDAIMVEGEETRAHDVRLGPEARVTRIDPIA